MHYLDGVQFTELVGASKAVSETRARKKKIAVLSDVARRLGPEETEPGITFLCGELMQGKLGIGFRQMSELRAEAALSAELSVLDVHQAFEQMRAISGKGSKSARRALLHRLFARCTEDEQQFVRRLLIGELRQGALEGVVAESLAQAFDAEPGSVRQAIMLSGRIAAVAAALRSGGPATLTNFRLQLLRPVQPMLAQPGESFGDAWGKASPACIEAKLDGARIQVHRDGESVKVFTRQLNDVTDRVPEIVTLAQSLPVRSVVLDGEAIALRQDERPQPFQVTMRRFGRKLEVEAMRSQLPLSCFFFDCLHLDGQDLLSDPLSTRIAAQNFLPANCQVPRLVTDNSEEAASFLNRTLAHGHEGAMLKSLETPYEAGRRGACWLKLKPTHTLDLVVLAAEWGSGRRKGYLSNLHLGARDEDSGSFVMLGKTFKGLTDELLRFQTRELQARELSRNDWTVFVRPELVVEIEFDGVQESSQYPGELALRFARVKRYRPDKQANQADTIATVRQLFSDARR